MPAELDMLGSVAEGLLCSPGRDHDDHGHRGHRGHRDHHGHDDHRGAGLPDF